MTAFKNDATGPWIEKDPEATLDFDVDWSVAFNSWLAGDTIASVAWTVEAGLTKAAESNSTTVAKVWLSGGTAGTTYAVTCRITTASTPARVDVRTFRVRVVQR